ncbi:MAG: hypothetical protein Fur0042_04430 [Cyanophyceae cyanobacterium]
MAIDGELSEGTAAAAIAAGWYIVRGEEGYCEVVDAAACPPHQEQQGGQPRDRWGPYGSRSEAIAKRVGLIRAGKCKPR